MASLSTIINNKVSTYQLSESNLEKGLIYFYTNGSGDDSDYQGGAVRCWKSPGNGSVTVEVWGASGSMAKTCCCAAQLPGNPGAYSKKTFVVDAASHISMDIGQSCYNEQLCYKGRSEPTCICWVGSLANGEICAGGGRGGYAICSNSAGMYCCLVAQGFPGQLHKNRGGAFDSGPGDGCGLVCNYVDGEIACACGGDVNICGGFSCSSYFHCNPCCSCYVTHHVRIAPGLNSTCGSVVTYNMECAEGYGEKNGDGLHQIIAGINTISRTPFQAYPWMACWAGHRMCTCYIMVSCTPYVPHGVPGVPSNTVADHRMYGYRGGHGAVKITYVGA